MADTSQTIQFDDFLKLDLRVVTVKQAEAHPKADKLLILQVDLGSEQRQVIAGLRGYYEPEQLVGRQIVVLTNLPPRKMRGLDSNGMLLAAVTPGETMVVVLGPEKEVPPGTKVS
jgi:methionine--tRNA ligase beta chain